ncbi:MAG: sulfatase-like hydrolase/transferase [Gemmataceae bacterium]
MLSLLLLATLAADPAPRPNLLVLFTDDQGYGDAGFQGHPELKTPHLDKLAASGLKLTQCYASAPVCSPSRAGLLTGQHPYRHDIRDWIAPNSGIYLPKTAPSLPRLLKAAGYRTALVGKWHLNSKMDGSEPTPADLGFDHWFATQNNAAPSHENPTNFVRNGKAVGPLKGNSSQLIVKEAIDWLKSGKPEQPFVLFVWFHAPHEPVAVSETWTKPYAALEPANRRHYLGSISCLDDAIGQLIDELQRNNQRERTLIFFSSDNGPETLNRYKGARRSYGTPGKLRGMKLHLTEGGIRVPGLLVWPGKIQPATSAVPVSNVDLLPTACELAGVKLPDAPLDGISLVPLFTGQPLNRSVPLYWQYDRALGGFTAAVRDGDWKLLADAKRDKLALYHLGDDPTESRDLSKEQPERLAALRKLLDERQRAIHRR